jgi:hypothetical protein
MPLAFIFLGLEAMDVGERAEILGNQNGKVLRNTPDDKPQLKGPEPAHLTF